MSLEDLKQLVQLANVLLIPAAILLWRLDKKVTELSITSTTWMKAHEEKDNMRFETIGTTLEEIRDRVKDLEHGPAA